MMLLGILCVWSCKETAQEITLSETQVSLYVGEKVALEANVPVDWMSDDTFYASVSTEGEVLAQHVGTTTIVAQGADGGRATCTVTVKPYFNTFTEPCCRESTGWCPYGDFYYAGRVLYGGGCCH